MNTIQFFPKPDLAQNWCKKKLEQGLKIGLVPTMGALHEGHLTLVDQSVQENDLCVVSIFVNPLQFNKRDDFEAYPRNFDEDLELLQNRGCHMAFTGKLMQFFPEAESEDRITLLEPGQYAQGLEGNHRPGHFAGVRTIVKKLFETCRPNRAYFGEKDFQQTLVIRDLAKEIGYPDICICPTQREKSGLAMSSRNQRLSSAQRRQAAGIYRALLAAKTCWAEGERSPKILQNVLLHQLTQAQLQIEYAEIRDPLNWSSSQPTYSLSQAQALIAVNLGDVRLIDNLSLN